MLLDFSNATEAELLTYIKSYEHNPTWHDLDISEYEEALNVLWDRFDIHAQRSPIGMAMNHRLVYFSECKNPSIDNMLEYLKQFVKKELI